MEDIKIAVKKAKKEEKQNPEYLYQLGMRFKNGDEAPLDMFKAAKYFDKAGKLGHAEAHKEHALFWWKTLKDYYFSEIYFKKALEAGCEEAKSLSDEMMREKEEKKALKAAKKSSGQSNAELYEARGATDSELNVFLKQHSLVCCPACGTRLRVAEKKTEGTLTEQYIEIHDKDTSFEKRYGPYTRPTYKGTTETSMLECDACKLSFTKAVRMHLDVKEADPTWKEVFTENNRTEWWYNVTVSYEADKTKTPKDALKIIKKSEGKFKGKYI